MGLLYSFLLQITVIIYHWVVSKATGINIPFFDFFFLIPCQLLILMLPTINGIGLRESSSIVLFGFYGTPESEAFMFGFIGLIMSFLSGFVTWLRFLMRSSFKKNVLALESDRLVNN